MRPTSIFFTGVLLVWTPLTIRGQSTIWAELITDNTTGGVNSICRDSNDNVYITGRTGPGAQVNGNPIGVLGSYDMYLIKFNSAGEFQWSQRGGGGNLQNPNEGDSGAGVVYDVASNAVYVCGSYEGTPATFGSNISFSGRGAFLAKYNTDGECIWVRHTSHGAAISLHVDGEGALVYTGMERNFPPDSTTFAGDPDVRIATGPFVAKYSTSGDLLLARNVGMSLIARAVAIGGHSIVYGTAQGPSSELLGTMLPTGSSFGSGFIASVDADFGDLDWTRTFNSSSNSVLIDHAMLPNGDHLLSGVYTDTLFTALDTLHCPAGEYRPFILKLDSMGVVEHWVMDLATNSSVASKFSEFQDGTVALVLPFVDSLRIGGQVFHADSEIDFLMARIDAEGVLISAVNRSAGSMSNMDLITMSDGGVVLGSPFSGTIDLGDGHVLTGGADIFVAKFGGFTGVPSLKTSANGELYIYANPNNGTCTIEMPEALQYEHDLVLRVIDLEGRLVQQSALRMNEGLIQLDIRAQATGTYVAEVGNGKVRYTGVIVFE